jgi:hypothetical protein
MAGFPEDLCHALVEFLFSQPALCGSNALSFSTPPTDFADAVARRSLPEFQ